MRNILLKKFLVNTIFRVAGWINIIVPKRATKILLYSNMGFRDNIEYLYKYLIENGYNQNYKIIRSQNEQYLSNLPENVFIVSNIRGIFEFLTAGHVFYTFGKIPIAPSKSQIVIQTWHGAPFKGADEMMLKTENGNKYYSYILCSSSFFAPIISKAFSISLDKVAICGQPRNDTLLITNNGYEEYKKFVKMIVWLPTYRKSTVLNQMDVSKQETIVPMFNKYQLESLNDELSRNNVILIVKLHPVQSLVEYDRMSLSNIEVLNHLEFMTNGYDLYRLLSQADALITDYSSVFFDYLLLNRPIGFSMDDFEDYNNKRGFTIDDPVDLMPGEKLYTREDFMNFIDHVIKGTDDWASERIRINNLTNKYKTACNCRQALELSNIINVRGFSNT